MTEYQQPIGGMWVRQDRNKRDYYYLQVEIGDLKYAFHAFKNAYKAAEKHPDFKVFALDGGEGKPVDQRFRPKPEGNQDKYAVKPPPAEEQNDESLEDDGIFPTAKEEDDDIPF